MNAQPPDPTLNHGRRLLAEFRGTHLGVAIAEVASDGITRRDWILSLPGQPPVVKPFTSRADMKAELKAALAELRLAKVQSQSQVPDPPRQAREFTSFLVGVWGDKSAPYKGQWVNVPLDAAEEGRRLLSPCHNPKPLTEGAPNTYAVAKKVEGHPELAVVEDWSYSLEGAYEKAQELDHGRISREPKPQPATEREARLLQKPNADRGPQSGWPVVRYDQPFLSPESARVTVVAVLPSRESALRFAGGRDDLAVMPNWFEALKQGDSLVASLEPDASEENAKKLNRIIQSGLTTEPKQEQHRESDTTKSDEVSRRATHLQGVFDDRSFRPVPVETLPTPSLAGRVWAAVRVMGTHGQDGALFQVVQLYDDHRKADLAAMLTKDLAVFPRSFAEGEFANGQCFAAGSVEGYANDANAKKIRKLVEAERARNPLQQPTNPEPEKRQQPGL